MEEIKSEALTLLRLKQFNMKKLIVWALRQLPFSSSRLLIIQDYTARHRNPSYEAVTIS